MRILLVEDHPIFRFGVHHLIKQRWEDAHIGESESLGSALREVRSTFWDMAIVDLNLSDSQGIESVAQIRRASPDLPLLVLSLHEESAYARQVLQLGAQGYLTKENAPDELIAAIQRVLGGGRYMSNDLAQSIALGAVTGDDKSALDSLGNQEYRVMLQLIGGSRVSEIASHMNISPKTVSTYRTRIFEKLGVTSNVDLARYCQLHQISGDRS
jgi:two-component system, NarL family, invasion response regulator UvrY